VPEWVNIDVPIKIVETWDKVYKVMTKLDKETLIGIDSEWKPYGPERTALLQVAIRSKVWLIDVVKLGRNRHDKHLKEKWIAFFRQLFCSKATKLGYDFSNDLRVLMATFPYLTELIGKEQNVICLFKTLTRVKNHSLGYKVFGGRAPDLNLKAVAKHFIDVDMSKGLRTHNWEIRPISSNLQNYAAVDAFCLLSCYDAIIHRMKRPGVGLDFLLTEVNIVYRPPNFLGKGAKKRRKRQQRERNREEAVGAIAASDDDDDVELKSNSTNGRHNSRSDSRGNGSGKKWGW